jgi:hypothetical protein
MVSGSTANELLPAFIAGLQSIKAWVNVFPPLSASGPNKGLIFSRSPAIQPEFPVVLPITFTPFEVTTPDTSSCEVPVESFPATIEFEKEPTPFVSIFTPPPAPDDALLVIVELTKYMRPAFSPAGTWS